MSSATGTRHARQPSPNEFAPPVFPWLCSASTIESRTPAAQPQTSGRAPQVGNFCKHLNVLSTSFDQSTLWTNEHVPATGTPAVQPVTPGGIFSGASVAGVEGGTFAFASRKAE